MWRARLRWFTAACDPLTVVCPTALDKSIQRLCLPMLLDGDVDESQKKQLDDKGGFFLKLHLAFETL